MIYSGTMELSFTVISISSIILRLSQYYSGAIWLGGGQF